MSRWTLFSVFAFLLAASGIAIVRAQVDPSPPARAQSTAAQLPTVQSTKPQSTKPQSTKPQLEARRNPVVDAILDIRREHGSLLSGTVLDGDEKEVEATFADGIEQLADDEPVRPTQIDQLPGSFPPTYFPPPHGRPTAGRQLPPVSYLPPGPDDLTHAVVAALQSYSRELDNFAHDFEAEGEFENAAKLRRLARKTGNEARRLIERATVLPDE